MPTAKKKQSLLNRINLKSPKTRGLVILIAFAVIGGGVMVFRSFAATLASVYTVGNGNIKTTASHDGKTYTREITLPSVNGKAGERAMQFDPGTKSSVRYSAAKVSTNALGILPNQKFKLCITQGGGSLNPFTGSAGGLVVEFKDSMGHGLRSFVIGGVEATNTSTTFIGNNKFEQCNETKFSSPTKLYGPVSLYYYGNTTMNLSAFTIYQVDN